MKKTKIAKIVALSTLSVVAPMAYCASAFAWGPERTTYTIEKPADKVTFDSITNNPNYGDERNFTIARAANEASDQWRDSIDIVANQEYIIRVYVHNNAASNLGLVSTNTRVAISVPNKLADNITVNGYIMSANADPKDIWDQVVFKSASSKFSLQYVAGSARYYNNANPSAGFVLPDSIVTEGGALVGYQQMDGNVPGCYEYSGIATIKVVAKVNETPPPVTPPETPAELPKTGPAEAVLAIIAILAITVGVVYWYKSRADMRKIALGKDGGTTSDVEPTPVSSSENKSEVEPHHHGTERGEADRQ
ncbi:MAG: hypothetical protein LBG75_02465 [Candidatus Nomurabacteria bacterium]|jgi:hypothetical protein|nr:hypothetical protein [Candidatus Nomurabacteria bacterium]